MTFWESNTVQPVKSQIIMCVCVYHDNCDDSKVNIDSKCKSTSSGRLRLFKATGQQHLLNTGAVQTSPSYPADNVYSNCLSRKRHKAVVSDRPCRCSLVLTSPAYIQDITNEQLFTIILTHD